jgi:hypothetical protein
LRAQEDETRTGASMDAGAMGAGQVCMRLVRTSHSPSETGASDASSTTITAAAPARAQCRRRIGRERVTRQHATCDEQCNRIKHIPRRMAVSGSRGLAPYGCAPNRTHARAPPTARDSAPLDMQAVPFVACVRSVPSSHVPASLARRTLSTNAPPSRRITTAFPRSCITEACRKPKLMQVDRMVAIKSPAGLERIVATACRAAASDSLAARP